MIEQVDAQVRAWLAGIAEGVEIWLDPPRANEQRKGIGLYLVGLGELPPPRGPTPAPLQVQLRYLVTAWAPSIEAEHKLLGDVVFAALARSDWQVAFGPLDREMWHGFGVPPRAAFVLLVPLRIERTIERARRVREIRTDFVRSGPFEGLVLGPGEIPVVGARVDFPGLGLSAATAGDGRFSFPRVPLDGRKAQLRVSARGEVQEVVATPREGGEQFTVRMKFGEE